MPKIIDNLKSCTISLQIVITTIVMAISGCSCTAYSENLLEIYLLAREKDPVFINAKLLHAQQLEQANMARSVLLPNISIQGNKIFYHIKNKSTPLPNNLHYASKNFSLNINQPLFQLANYWQYQKTKTEVLTALKQYEIAEQELIIRVTEKYFATLAALDTLTASIAEYKFITEKLAQIQQKFKVGTNTITDVYEAQAKLDSVNAKKITNANDFRITKEQLYQIIAKNIINFTPLKLELDLPLPNPQDLSAWLNKARQYNLNIQAAHYAVTATKEQLNSTYSENLPTINLNGAIGKASNTPQDKSYNLTKQIGLYLNLPLFSGGSTLAKTKAALLANDMALQQLELTYRNIETNTIIAFNNIINAVNNINALNQSIKSHTSALAANQAAFTVGTRTILDVLNLQTNLIHAKREYAKSKYDYIINSLKLKQAIGTLCLEDIVAINNLLADNGESTNHTVTEKIS